MFSRGFAVDIFDGRTIDSAQLPTFTKWSTGRLWGRRISHQQVAIAFRLARFSKSSQFRKNFGQTTGRCFFHLRDGVFRASTGCRVYFQCTMAVRFFDPPSSNAWPVVPDLAIEVIHSIQQLR